MADKKNLILQDFRNKHCFVKRTGLFYDPFSEDGMFNYDPYKFDNIIATVYDNSPDDFTLIFICLHDKLNKSLDFMRKKASVNNHYNANDSRELITLINDIFSLQSNLSKLGVDFEIRKDYSNWMLNCLEFLEQSGGSTIPENLEIPNSERYEPIFSIKDEVAEQRLKSTKVVYSSQYQKEQSKKLLAMIKTDTVKAVGMAKEYIETCLQGILDGKIRDDVEKMGIPTLMAKAREYFNLNSSNNSEVNKIIKGLSQAANGLSELRNHKGSGHSHTEKRPQPTECEAQLAVDTAITIVNFYSNLNQQKQK